jgi:hypothetical protein
MVTISSRRTLAFRSPGQNRVTVRVEADPHYWREALVHVVVVHARQRGLSHRETLYYPMFYLEERPDAVSIALMRAVRAGDEAITDNLRQRARRVMRGQR